MKKLIALLLISTQAFAGLPPTSIKGQTDASPKTKFQFQAPHNQVTDLGGIKALIETDSSNILPDPGFEAATSGWTASGGATATTNSTAKGTGALGYDWDSNSASQTLQSTSVTIPNGFGGKNGVASCQIKTVYGTATHTLTVNDGTNDIITPVTIQSSTTAFLGQNEGNKINFVFPASGTTIRLKIASVASNEPEIYIDDCRIALADNVYEAPVIGPWEPYTPTFTGFGTVTNIECKSRRNGENRDVDCKFTSGTNTATEARISLPNGLITAGINLIPSIRKIGDVIFSGTGTVADVIGSSFAVLAEPSVSYVTFGTRYSGGSALTKTLGTTFASTAAHSVNFSVPIAGYSAISAQSADQTDYDWTSYTPTLTGVGTATNVSFKHSRVGPDLLIKGSFTAGTVSASLASVTLPNGLSIDTSKTTLNVATGNAGPVAGKWTGGTTADHFGPIVLATSTNAGLLYFGYNSSTTSLNQFNGNFAFSTGEVISLEARVPIQGWSSNQRAPTLVGSVTSNAQNAERIERAFITISGGTPSITSQSGSWISSLTDNGVGDISINYSSNTFSSAPTCVCTAVWPGASTGGVCNINTNSTTTTQFKISNDAGAAADYSFYMHCMGPR